MRALLHEDLQVGGTVLHDKRLNCDYTLTPDAAWVIRQLAKESHLGLLIPRVARLKRISQTEAAQAVHDTCGQLGRFGGLHMQWDASFGFVSRLQANARWRQREAVTLVGFMRSMARAYGLLCVLLVGLFMYGKFLAGNGVSWWLLMAPLAVCLSCIMHEAGHVLAARKAHVTGVLLASVGYMALMYRRPAAGVMRRIALAGPLPVAVLCGGGALLASSVFMQFVLGAAAITHALCLLPVCADGRAIWASGRRV